MRRQGADVSFFDDHLRELGPAWMGWDRDGGAAARAEARRRDVPICCFAAEAGDPAAARAARILAADREWVTLLEEGFVPATCDVAVDPASAQRFQGALLRRSGLAGWPAVAFVLPGGDCLGASPWPDDDPRSVAPVATAVLDVWRCRRDDALADAADLEAAIADGPQDGPPPDELVFGAAEAAAIEAADRFEGGFGAPPRRAEVAILDFLCVRARSGAPPSVLATLRRALDALLAGAVHDHLGGGFFRGARDRAWELPRCDKRCADQAQLALLLFDAAEVCARPFYADAACAALGFALGELRLDDGTFAHALHGESHGAADAPVEGAYYAWCEDAVAEVVGERAATAFAGAYLRGATIGDGWHIPALRDRIDPDSDLVTACARLAAARRDRPRPPRREIACADEQGMMLAALCRAAAERPEEGWDAPAAALAARCPDFEDRAAIADGEALGAAQLGGLAWLARGHLAHHRLTGDATSAKAARRCLGLARALRRTDGRLALEAGGTPAQAADDGLPAAAAVLARALLEAADLEPDAARDAAKVIAARGLALRAAPLACAGLLATALRRGG